MKSSAELPQKLHPGCALSFAFQEPPQGVIVFSDNNSAGDKIIHKCASGVVVM